MNLSIDTNIDSRTMKDYVYQVLKRNIMELRLKPGTPLKKEKISRQLQVSVTPVRKHLPNWLRMIWWIYSSEWYLCFSYQYRQDNPGPVYAGEYGTGCD